MSSTAEELRTEAKERADMVKSKFISDGQWLIWISDGYLALYDMLVSAFEDYYIKQPPYEFTADSTGVVALPSDFYKFRGLDRMESGVPQTVLPYLFEERNRVNSSYQSIPSNCWPGVRYQIFGQSSIYLKPPENAVGDYQLWYVPRATKVTDPATVIDGINGWENYISLTAARKALLKEETSTTGLDMEIAEIVGRITTMAKNRDLANTGRVRDVRSRDIRRGSFGDFGDY